MKQSPGRFDIERCSAVTCLVRYAAEDNFAHTHALANNCRCVELLITVKSRWSILSAEISH